MWGALQEVPKRLWRADPNEIAAGVELCLELGTAHTPGWRLRGGQHRVVVRVPDDVREWLLWCLPSFAQGQLPLPQHPAADSGPESEVAYAGWNSMQKFVISERACSGEYKVG